MHQNHLTRVLDYKASGNSIEGYASVFNIVDKGGDIVVPGAFKQSLREFPQPLFLWQHQMDTPIGVTTSVGEDTKGLEFRADFANTQAAQEARELAGMGALGGFSIGYQALDVDFDKENNRLLKQVAVFEVSLVSLPMNPSAEITAVKSLSPRQYECFLRDAGHSRRFAKTQASALRDAGESPELAEIIHGLDGLTERMLIDPLADKLRI